MLLLEQLADMLGGKTAELMRQNADALSELRLRINRPAQLRLLSGASLFGEKVEALRLTSILNRLMDNSMYACERELQRGYFTAMGGCRIGVCGKIGAGGHGIESIGSIGSVCIRIPRQVVGCAQKLYSHVLQEQLRSMLILSLPGMGKTTLLRDLVRMVSNQGYSVCIADERREIAACVEGVPQLDVGSCSDVMDGLEKAIAIPMMIRACAPDMIAVDELGGAQDAQAVRHARRCGIAVCATAHASGMEDASSQPHIAPLLLEGIFDCWALLGPRPGEIEFVHECADERYQHAQSRIADHRIAGLHGGGQIHIGQVEAQV